jgi:hypothetical protein
MTAVNLQAFEPGTVMVIDAYQVRVAVRTDSPALLDQVLPHLPPGWRAAPGRAAGRQPDVGRAAGRQPDVRRWYGLEGGGGYRLTVDQEVLLVTPELEPALECLESDLQLFVAEMAAERVFVHAGVVGMNGRALVLPGRSLSGKSTLVAALLRAGAAYYSDEYAVFDSAGRVHPYPRRLSLRQRHCRWRQRVTAEELGSRRGVEPLPVGRILFVQYFAAGRWRPEALTPGKALLAMINHTVSIRRQPAAALSVIERATRGIPVLTGIRGDADQFARDLVRGAI